MQGAETIRAIRALDISALIVGSSGNDLRAEHLAAGADLFWRKPTPQPASMAQQLRSRLPLPTAWRVLLADDNSTVAFIMQRKLGLALPRAEVTVVSSGKAATAAIAAEPYDLLVLDNDMGDGVMGTDVSRLARAAESLSLDAVVVGFSRNSMEAEFLEAGCDAVWSKSINADEIKASLLETLRVPRAATMSSTAGTLAAAEEPLIVVAPVATVRPHGLQKVYDTHGAEGYDTITTMFSEQAKVEVAELRAHMAAGSWGAAQSLAHKMKGATCMLGLDDCAAKAAKLEAALKRVVADPGTVSAATEARVQSAAFGASIEVVVAALDQQA